MSPPNKKSKCGKIAAAVRKKAAAGVPVTEIFASIQTYQNAPGSLTTFYKYYRDDVESARGDITEKIGSKVVNQALAGDFKSQDLWLTTKGGWSKQNTNTNVDVVVEDEAGSALDLIMSRLGIKQDKEK